MKKLLFLLVLFFLSSTANANALPKPDPVAPVPNIDTTPTPIGIKGDHVIRPVPSANAETYKKIPLDKAKVGGYIKKMPKGGLLEVGIAVGIVALGEAVDYLIDNSNVVRFEKLQCKTIGYGNFTTDTKEQFIARMKSEVFKDNFSTFFYNEKDQSIYRNYNLGSGDVSIKVGVCHAPKKSEIPLDDLADKLIESGKKGNPNAVKIINDWADDEVRRNPDAYPDVVPQPQPQPNPAPNPDPKTNPGPLPQPTPIPNPNPIGDPKTNPSPNPNAPPSGNPATNPNPADNSNGTPNAQPDPATNPNNGTKPNEQIFKFELPAFCGWATIVCEFIGVKPDMPDMPDMPTKDMQLKSPAEFDKPYVDFGGQCPADVSVDLDMGFASHTVVFPFTPICRFITDYLSLVVLFGAYLFATLHISSAFKV